MFVALRDLRFARGRFALIAVVVALITTLVGFLSGLTGGLAAQNISALLALPTDRIVLSTPSVDGADPSYADSVITADAAASWVRVEGVADVHPIGITQGRAESARARAAIALFGVEPGFDDAAPSRNGELVLSEPAADSLEVSVGDTVAVLGAEFTVAAVAGDLWYSHTPVVRMTLADWQEMAALTGNPDAYATVLAVSGEPDWSAADTAIGTVSNTVVGSLTALSSFRSEIGSLLLMVVMLFGISGLVIGAFFTVWTMQRRGDIAVLKALGASTRALRRDALGQALVVLVIGVGIGLSVVLGLGSLAATALPFLLSPLTTALPAALLIALGLAGAAFALRSIVSADPLTALGSNR